MGWISERLSYFFSLIAFALSLSLAITSLLTPYWFSAQVVNDRGIPPGSSRVHAGLFSGVRLIDWGLGIRRAPFSVTDEISDGTGFMGKATWFFTVSTLIIGMVWLVVAILTALAATVTRKTHSITGPCGIYLWSLLSIISLSLSALIYYMNFSEGISRNTLLPEQLESGFSTQNQASLGYSFFMLCVAILTLYLPPLLLCCCAQRKGRVRPATERSTTFVATKIGVPPPMVY